jgi:hypothetical protein
MFSRRHARTYWQKIKESMWPSMGFYRMTLYYRHRMGRMKETPYAVAAGFASGVAISFTPFLGFHLMLGAMLTWLLRGSFLAMVLGSVVAGNFWTYPFIFVTTYKLGKFIMGQTPHINRMPELFTWEIFLKKPLEYFVPMTLGSLPFCVLSWAVAFYVVRRVVKGYKEARHQRIHQD